MPFINSKISTALSEEQEKTLVSRLGQAVTLIPGKSESWLMTGFEPEYHLYFRGENSTPAAFVEVKLFGSENKSAFAALTAASPIRERSSSDNATEGASSIIF